MTNDAIEELSDSDKKTIVSKDRFIELLFQLEQDLEELKKEDEEDVLNHERKKTNSQNLPESEKKDKKMDGISENEASEETFLGYHLEELKKLKKLSTLTTLEVKDIEWFFDTALFDLMNELPECFVIEPEEIYQCMLERIEITSKKYFQEHLTVLLRKKTEEKNTFPFVRFFPILSAKTRGRAVFWITVFLCRQSGLNCLFHLCHLDNPSKSFKL